MSKRKFAFIIILIVIFLGISLQHIKITELKWERNHCDDIIRRVESDLNTFKGAIFKDISKKRFQAMLKTSDPSLEIFEYNEGCLKMRGLDIGFDKEGRLISLSIQTY